MKNFLLTEKFTAFTLAEVIITIGIIGVVAAMTLPSVITNYRIKQHEAAFKRADALIQQAIKKSLFEMGYSDISEINIAKWSYDPSYNAQMEQSVAELNKIFLKQFKGIKKLPGCSDLYAYTKIKQNSFFGDPPNGGCYMTETASISSRYNTYLLSNGMAISQLGWRYKTNEKSHYFAGIQVSFDTNGPYKGPNRVGHDIFTYVSLQRATDVMCNPLIQHSRNWMGCYFFAQKNQNPLNASEPYWKMLYTPLSYWQNYNKKK